MTNKMASIYKEGQDGLKQLEPFIDELNPIINKLNALFSKYGIEDVSQFISFPVRDNKVQPFISYSPDKFASLLEGITR
jgi:hypothetical protein